MEFQELAKELKIGSKDLLKLANSILPDKITSSTFLKYDKEKSIREYIKEYGIGNIKKTINNSSVIKASAGKSRLRKKTIPIETIPEPAKIETKEPAPVPIEIPESDIEQEKVEETDQSQPKFVDVTKLNDLDKTTEDEGDEFKKKDKAKKYSKSEKNKF